LTPQQIFDRVVEALRVQGRPSFAPRPEGGIRCLYRGPDGAKCAAGCLIADEYYTAALDRSAKSVAASDVSSAIATSIGLLSLSKDDEELLLDLQRAHDSAAGDSYDAIDIDLPQWRRLFVRRALRVAHQHGLSNATLLAWPEAQPNG
jgi:hypothetical protein